MQNNNGRDIAIKTLVVTLLLALFIGLVYNVYSGGGSGFVSRILYGEAFDFNSFVTFVLVVAVKLLWMIFIISLIVGMVLQLKKNMVGEKRVKTSNQAESGNGYTCPCCNTKLTVDFKFCPNCKASLKDICTKCGKELQVGWKCCPICGTEKK